MDELIQIQFICHNCQQINKEKLGLPKFELINCIFESFSEAWEHQFNNRNHYIGIQNYEYTEEE